jgi:hypothetical protein
MQYYECPYCRYRISTCVIDKSKYDYGCPRGHTSTYDFTLKGTKDDKYKNIP